MAGTLISPARNNIFIEGSQFRDAISEDLLQRFGASVNFINAFQYFQFYFGMLGFYGTSAITVPFQGVGTFETFDQNASIVNIWVYNGAAGSSGTTDIDILWAPVNSSSFTSILGTRPTITSAAASGVFFDANNIASLPSGCVRPILSKVNFNSGDKLRMDLINKQSGNAADLQVQIFWRPR